MFVPEKNHFADFAIDIIEVRFKYNLVKFFIQVSQILAWIGQNFPSSTIITTILRNLFNVFWQIDRDPGMNLLASQIFNVTTLKKRRKYKKSICHRKYMK